VNLAETSNIPFCLDPNDLLDDQVSFIAGLPCIFYLSELMDALTGFGFVDSRGASVEHLRKAPTPIFDGSGNSSEMHRLKNQWQ
jgi:hypothetical protein